MPAKFRRADSTPVIPALQNGELLDGASCFSHHPGFPPPFNTVFDSRSFLTYGLPQDPRPHESRAKASNPQVQLRSTLPPASNFHPELLFPFNAVLGRCLVVRSSK
jgi:hypothetical protein